MQNSLGKASGIDCFLVLTMLACRQFDGDLNLTSFRDSGVSPRQGLSSKPVSGFSRAIKVKSRQWMPQRRVVEGSDFGDGGVRHGKQQAQQHGFNSSVHLCCLSFCVLHRWISCRLKIAVVTTLVVDWMRHRHGCCTGAVPLVQKMPDVPIGHVSTHP